MAEGVFRSALAQGPLTSRSRDPGRPPWPGTQRQSAVLLNVAEGDGDELLPGETASAHSRDIEDARRWFDTYDDLCRMKQNVLTELESQRDHVRPEGLPEVNEDEGMLRAEYYRLRERREFWHSEIEARRTK